MAQQFIHSRPALPRYSRLEEELDDGSFGDMFVMVLGRCSFRGEARVIESEESSPVSWSSGDDERSIIVGSSVSSTCGGGKKDMRFACWLLRFGRKNGDDGKNADKGLADWG